MSYRDFTRNSRYNDGTTWFRADDSRPFGLHRTSWPRLKSVLDEASVRRYLKSEDFLQYSLGNLKQFGADKWINACWACPKNVAYFGLIEDVPGISRMLGER